MLNHQKRPVILTGDRTTGPLHLGHLAGSLLSRVSLQHTHQQFLLLADAQALTDNAQNPARLREYVLEVAADYLAIGIDPSLTTICVQSELPALAALTMLYLNFVTVARLERTPTIKDEIQARGFGRDIPAGFLCYPVAQAADITAFKATIIPVGEDQVPLIEQTNEIVRRVNRQIGGPLLPQARALLSNVPRLPGPDGKSKMSKSLKNVLPLSSSDNDIAVYVNDMYTDSNHARVSDPGRVEGNVVFMYLDAFDTDVQGVDELKSQYRRGGLGDGQIKQRLISVLSELIGPIRERRASIVQDQCRTLDIIRDGTLRARDITQRTYVELRDGLGLFSLD
jgi:tryptophanyl-tRNA synthetase